jgi:2-polyprenyl-3-methyl-5-hydroxy-6-metoxy-1,4-benzoquinol methylase
MGVAQHAFVAADLNRATSDERFAYARCNSCGTYFLVSPPSDMSPYYPKEYYELPSVEQLDAAAQSEQFKVQMLLDWTEPGRLVEVGPGVGIFARAARNANFDVTAIEMDSRACEYLRSVVGVDAIQSDTPHADLPTLPPSQAVVLWHVIEHLPSPVQVLEQAARNLASGGVLAIASPNPHALQFKLLRRRWPHLDAPRHLFLIPAHTLARQCVDLGLRPVHTTTADPGGRFWNRFGWDYALRRSPRSESATPARTKAAGMLARALAPLETRGERGCAYTSLFVKSAK